MNLPAALPERPLSVTLIVVGTIAAVAIIYALTLSICALGRITPAPDLLAALKDVGLVALGALGSMLARTASQTAKPDDAPPASETLALSTHPGGRHRLSHCTSAHRMKTRTVSALLLTAAFLALAGLYLTGCAGSAADTGFRRQVSAVDLGATTTYDPVTGVTGGSFSTRFELRNPARK